MTDYPEMKKYPELYKRTSTGAVQVWFMEQEGALHHVVSGQLEGKKVTSDWKRCTGKNIGKKNETSPEKQATAEIKAIYKKKLAIDYHEKVADIDKQKIFKPMLANKYVASKIDWEEDKFFSQPKLDGIRCIATVDGLFTRKGKPILSCPHIIEELAPFFKQEPTLVLDGEMYNHALRDDFNKITSLVRKQKPTEEDLQNAADWIEYHVYDAPSCDDTFFMREKCYQIVFEEGNKVIPVETTWVKNAAQLDACYGEYLQEGYEGQIIRQNELYQNKRSKFLLKRKEFITEEFKILRLEEGEGNWSVAAKSVFCLLSDGRSFGSGIKGSRENGVKLLEQADALVGKLATIRYFELTPDGIPRFGVAIDFDRGDV